MNRRIYMNIAYVRVSSAAQNTDRQIEELKKYDIDKWYIDKTSGKNLDRPQFLEMMKFIREGDNLYFKDYSRVARNTKELLDLFDILIEKGVKIISDKDGEVTNAPSNKMMRTVLSAMYEFERAIILENQAEGIQIAKSKGKYKGRKSIPIPSNWDYVINRLERKEISIKQASKELNMSISTVYRKKNQLSR